MATSYTLSIITLGLCVFGFFYFRWYISRKLAATEILAEYRDEVHRLIAEIDAATDRDSLLVEERIKALRRLLDDTDKRITVYTRELERSRSGEAIYSSLGRGIRAALDTHPVGRPPPPQEASSLETAPDNRPGDDAPPLEAVTVTRPESRPGEGAPPSGGSPPSEAGGKEKAKKRQIRPEAGALAATEKKPFEKPKKLKAQIAQLAEEGLSPSEIASRLEIGQGEVELALNLLDLS